MSDLTTFAKHASEMAASKHKPDCTGVVLGRWSDRVVRPDPMCGGCVSDDERALWARLAAEVDEYLTDDQEALL